MKKILVTGANGQLGRCIKDATKQFPQMEFTFADRDQLNIDEATSVKKYFEENSFDYCINTAAYTNVEKAESDADAAFKTNAEGVKNLAEACNSSHIVLLHVSTDYVFDGEKNTPYVETDTTNPISVYGASKLTGEQYIEENCEAYFIFRTSWLYSQYGHNFLNSMLGAVKKNIALSITTEQLGTPTNANDLAEAVLAIVASGSKAYGLYHFSNTGSGTWYDFAEAIFTYSRQLKNVKLGKTAHYRTFAKRPAYSILSTEKFKKTFGISPIDWKTSLAQLLQNHTNHK